MSPARIKALTWGGLVIAFAIAGALLIAPNSDTLISLAWGNVLGGGVRPNLDAVNAPVPHPLPILLAAPLSLLPSSAAMTAWTALWGLSVLLLLAATFKLARATGGTGTLAVVAAALAVVIVATRPRIVYYALTGAQDIPFAAFVMLAIALVAERPTRSPLLPFGLIAAAGLLRPEGWVIGAAYLAFLALRGTRGHELRVAAGLAAAPVLVWAAFDLVMSGNPVASIEHARRGATALSESGFTGRDFFDLDFATQWLPNRYELSEPLLHLPAYLGTPLLAAGLAGMGVGALFAYRWVRGTRDSPGTEDPPPSHAIAAGGVILLLGTFFAETALGFTVIDRYSVGLAASVIAIGVGIIGRLGHRLAPGMALLALLAGLTMVENPDQLRRDQRTFPFANKLRETQRDLADLVRVDEVETAMQECPRLISWGRDRRKVLEGRSILALYTDRDPERIALRRIARTKNLNSFFSYAVEHGDEPLYSRGRWAYRSKCVKET